MGWIIFVFVVLVVVTGMRRRTTRVRARMSRQGAELEAQPVQTSQTYQKAQSRQFAKSIRAFQAAMSLTKAPGAPSVLRAGNSQTYEPGNSPTYPAGNSATYRSGYSPTYQPDDSGAFRPGDSPTYTPVGPMGSRPMASPPDPQLQRYQGSTAVSGTALSSTLFSPYQPSSLMTSLSSSLSSSLTDSPPRMGKTSAFGGIEIIPLPDEVVDQVRFHLRNGHEVEAVRLVCDTMNVGLLEATKTVRSYA